MKWISPWALNPSVVGSIPTGLANMPSELVW